MYVSQWGFKSGFKKCVLQSKQRIVQDVFGKLLEALPNDGTNGLNELLPLKILKGILKQIGGTWWHWQSSEGGSGNNRSNYQKPFGNVYR